MRTIPVKKYVDGGPGLSDRKWSLMTGLKDPYFTSDPFGSPVGANPPGMGNPITSATGGINWNDPNKGATFNNGIRVTTPTTGIGVDWQKATDIGNSLAPYASNIVNAFRKPPMPGQPIMDSPPVLQKVNMDADRVQVEREINSANTAAERGLASNQAVAVRQFNMGQKLNELGKINQNERNTNTGISNQNAIYAAQTSASNNAKKEDYNQSVVERNVAQQREQSANLSNASDKYISIQNELRKADTDQKKAQILSGLYAKSGVMDRQRKQWKAQGLADPMGRDYKDLKD